MTLFCGDAQVIINPPVGTLLAGYMAERYTLGVHDPIMAKVVYLKSGDTKLLLLSLDLVGVDLAYVKRLRNRLSQQFSIPTNNILIHATHTHSGPGGMIHETSPIWKAFSAIWMPYNESIVEDQHEKITDATREAIATADKCSLRFSEGESKGIAANRISPEREYHPKLSVIEMIKSTGKMIVLYHFACHPTILHADNCLVSADFPGVTNTVLENMEDIEMALFFNGPCGDISTRFTRESSTFEEVERMGNILANEIKSTLNQTKNYQVDHIFTEVIPFELSIRAMKKENIVKEELHSLEEILWKAKEWGLSSGETRIIESKIEGVTASLQLAQKIEGIETIQTEIQILRLGNICLASIPGEAFYETGTEILEALKSRDLSTLLLGNTNDYIGYIVPEHYYEEGSYEASMTLLEKGSAEKVRDLLINHIGGI